MPRPSRSLDRKLVAAARGMLPDAGLSGLSIREVARRAGVNIGMFHYHFKTKRAFHLRILQESYEDFYEALRAAAQGAGPPRARLRRLLVAAARFARDNRVFPTLMVRELLNGHPDARAFAVGNFPRHVALVMGLLEECRRDGTVRPLPVPVLAMFAMGSMAIPVLLVSGLERNRVKALAGKPLDAFAGLVLSDAMIETRADMVLAGLAPEKRR